MDKISGYSTAKRGGDTEIHKFVILLNLIRKKSLVVYGIIYYLDLTNSAVLVHSLIKATGGGGFGI